MAANTNVNRVRDTIVRVLNTYESNIVDRIGPVAKVTVEEMVQRTKQRRTTRYSTGKYARLISHRDGEHSLHRRSHIWYVKEPKYRITHLINNGHALVNGGRYPGDKHVTKAAEQAEIDFMTRVEEVIRNANN